MVPTLFTEKAQAPLVSLVVTMSVPPRLSLQPLIVGGGLRSNVCAGSLLVFPLAVKRNYR